MTRIDFYKMQGSGNDFVMIDNRAKVVADSDKVSFVKSVCPRATAVGADGVIFIEEDNELDFSWDFYNADGSSAEMCGNGARCSAVFAEKIGVASGNMTFRTIAGPIAASLIPGGAKVQLTDSALPEHIPALAIEDGTMDLWFLDTGVPHVIVFVDDLETIDVPGLGAAIRYHNRFAPAGTNVNFVSLSDGNVLYIRTYERGVEGETLACGTGSVAAAIASSAAHNLASPVTVNTRSGALLKIHFSLQDDSVTDIFLEGPVVTTYEGVLHT